MQKKARVQFLALVEKRSRCATKIANVKVNAILKHLSRASSVHVGGIPPAQAILFLATDQRNIIAVNVAPISSAARISVVV